MIPLMILVLGATTTAHTVEVIHHLTHLLPLAVITQTIIELLTMTTMVAHYRKTHT